jgi:GxxExxY protein
MAEMRDTGQLLEAPAALSEAVIGAAIEVHRTLGPGLLESVYEAALAIELDYRAIEVRRQLPIEVNYRGIPLGLGFRVDVIVGGVLLVEIKAVERLNDIHLAQAITYLRILGLKRGLLLNFNEAVLRDGIKRVSI